LNAKRYQTNLYKIISDDGKNLYPLLQERRESRGYTPGKSCLL
jgi:hypothetical protein